MCFWLSLFSLSDEQSLMSKYKKGSQVVWKCDYPIFCVQVGQVLNLFSLTKYLIEKTNQQILVKVATKELFEFKICKRVDVLFLYSHTTKIIISSFLLSFLHRVERNINTRIPLAHAELCTAVPGLPSVFGVIGRHFVVSICLFISFIIIG